MLQPPTNKGVRFFNLAPTPNARMPNTQRHAAVMPKPRSTLNEVLAAGVGAGGGRGVGGDGGGGGCGG